MPRNNGGGAETPRSKPQSPLRITHDGEFYARLLSKEISTAGGNPSFRYYGAGPGAVPFVWESHPGTPKDAAHSSSATAVGGGGPAIITPPPSYHLRAAGAGAGGQSCGSRRRSNGKGGGRTKSYCGYKLNRWIKIGFIATVFRRLAFGKPVTTRSSAPASVKSSSTRWLFSAASGAAAEGRDMQAEYCYEPPPAATKTKGMRLCLGVRASPASSWMVQFWGGGRREPDGWVYGWRP